MPNSHCRASLEEMLCPENAQRYPTQVGAPSCAFGTSTPPSLEIALIADNICRLKFGCGFLQAKILVKKILLNISGPGDYEEWWLFPKIKV